MNDVAALRLGVGGPVGSGKTALVAELCRRLGGEFEISAVTNDIYTREDAEFLERASVFQRAGSWVLRPAAARIPRSGTTSR